MKIDAHDLLEKLKNKQISLGTEVKITDNFNTSITYKVVEVKNNDTNYSYYTLGCESENGLLKYASLNWLIDTNIEVDSIDELPEFNPEVDDMSVAVNILIQEINKIKKELKDVKK